MNLMFVSCVRSYEPSEPREAGGSMILASVALRLNLQAERASEGERASIGREKKDQRNCSWQKMNVY